MNLSKHFPGNVNVWLIAVLHVTWLLHPSATLYHWKDQIIMIHVLARVLLFCYAILSVVVLSSPSHSDRSITPMSEMSLSPLSSPVNLPPSDELLEDSLSNNDLGFFPGREDHVLNILDRHVGEGFSEEQDTHEMEDGSEQKNDDIDSDSDSDRKSDIGGIIKPAADRLTAAQRDKFREDHVTSKKQSLMRYLEGIVATWEHGIDARGPWKDLDQAGWFFENQKLQDIKTFMRLKDFYSVSLQEMVDGPFLSKCIQSNICSLSNIVQLLSGRIPEEGILSEYDYGKASIKFDRIISGEETGFPFLTSALHELMPVFGSVEELMEDRRIIFCCRSNSRRRGPECLRKHFQSLLVKYSKPAVNDYQTRVNLAKVESV